MQNKNTLTLVIVIVVLLVLGVVTYWYVSKRQVSQPPTPTFEEQTTIPLPETAPTQTQEVQPTSAPEQPTSTPEQPTSTPEQNVPAPIPEQLPLQGE